MKNTIKQCGQDLAGLFFPNNCSICRQNLVEGEEQVCGLCLTNLPLTNFHKQTDSALDMKLAGRFHYNRALAMYYFNTEGAVRDILHQIKYNRNDHLARYMGKLIGQFFREEIKNIDVLIPIPLHNRRIEERGYNQSELLAEGVSSFLNIPVNIELVARIKNTETQTHKTRIERVQNMEGAFEWQDTDGIQDKSILLIDDVITTGSTLESCILSAPKNIQKNFSILSLATAIES